jgi:hypothetical protein
MTQDPFTLPIPDLDSMASTFDEACLEHPQYKEKIQEAHAAFDAWADGGEDVSASLWGFLTWEARRFILGVRYGEIPDPNNWLADADEFLATELPTRKPYLVDARTGGAVLLEGSINQLFAFRGIGKSVVVNALLKPLVTGRDWLHFHSPGGLRVVLVDGELPKSQLQERLREFTGDEYGGRLKIISPELMKNEKAFPVLSVPDQQEKFFRQIEAFEPQVIVFDTLSSIFRFDTNDTNDWGSVNDFLRRLRFAGYCVLIVHHAGKNNTQRGRTDGDDHLDVAIQLEKRSNWTPGDGLQFEWKYEKVRHGAWLAGFEAGYDKKTQSWALLEDDRTARVMEMAAKGETERQIAKALDISQATVNRIKDKAARLAKLNGDSGESR